MSKRINHWLKNVLKNLQPFSISEVLKDALAEWVYMNIVVEVPKGESRSCELCEHPDLRYIFATKNPGTGKVLWVGKECVKKFVSNHLTKGTLTSQEMGRELSRDVKDHLQKEKDRLWCDINVLTNSLNFLSKKEWLGYVEKGFPLERILELDQLVEMYGFPYQISGYRISETKNGGSVLQSLTAREYDKYRPALSGKWQKILDNKFKME